MAIRTGFWALLAISSSLFVACSLPTENVGKNQKNATGQRGGDPAAPTSTGDDDQGEQATDDDGETPTGQPDAGGRDAGGGDAGGNDGGQTCSKGAAPMTPAGYRHIDMKHVSLDMPDSWWVFEEHDEDGTWHGSIIFNDTSSPTTAHYYVMLTTVDLATNPVKTAGGMMDVEKVMAAKFRATFEGSTMTRECMDAATGTRFDPAANGHGQDTKKWVWMEDGTYLYTLECEATGDADPSACDPILASFYVK